MILLDTNILSELMRPAPAPEVEAWLGAQPSTGVFISAVTEAELRFGLALLPDVTDGTNSPKPSKACWRRISPLGFCPSTARQHPPTHESPRLVAKPAGPSLNLTRKLRRLPPPAMPCWRPGMWAISRAAEFNCLTLGGSLRGDAQTG